MGQGILEFRHCGILSKIRHCEGAKRPKQSRLEFLEIRHCGNSVIVRSVSSSGLTRGSQTLCHPPTWSGDDKKSTQAWQWHKSKKIQNKRQVLNSYYVYILTNKTNSVIYIGITNNLLRRLYEHKNKLLKGFTKKYNVNKLVYFEQTSDINEAIKREKTLKKWNREWKIELIKKQNPEFKDLSSEWEF